MSIVFLDASFLNDLEGDSVVVMFHENSLFEECSPDRVTCNPLDFWLDGKSYGIFREGHIRPSVLSINEPWLSFNSTCSGKKARFNNPCGIAYEKLRITTPGAPGFQNGQAW